MQNDNKICLGAIAGVHGIKGEVKVKSFTEIDSDIDKYGPLEDQHGRYFEIKVVGRSKELLRVKIKGVEDRTQAETLTGTQFFVDRDVLPPLEDEDEFYHADLVGLDVKEEKSSEAVGKVVAVYNFGSGEILEIKLDNAKSTEMIPFSHSYVPEVNIKNGYIIVSSVSLRFDQEEGDIGAED
jgi:16S rRNA processing protein RimM